MNRSLPLPNDSTSLRASLLQAIADANIPGADSVKALAQCQAHFANRGLVEETLQKCGLLASGFLANEHLELYYDIARGRRDLGYICKGWDDPGFRIADVVPVPAGKIQTLKQHAPALMQFCATRGVALTGETNASGRMEFSMESVIYSDGFNQKVFAQVLDCLTECVEEARTIMRDG